MRSYLESVYAFSSKLIVCVTWICSIFKGASVKEHARHNQFNHFINNKDLYLYL